MERRGRERDEVDTNGGDDRERNVQYSEAMKARMIKRMTGPNAMSATTVSQQTGIPQPTLSRWLRAAGTLRLVSKDQDMPPDANVPRKRAQDWTAQEKLQAVVETAAMSDDELGAYLRRNGLHREQLESWREQAAGALANDGARRRRGGPTPEQKRIRELERELRRKEKALAEAAALLVLKKKADALFGVEEDDTDPRSDE